ncbi:Diphthine--ammonia ligase [Sparassis crispa]|uniref:Diphthine--ammonia ligase n=1 Tax=Sparassis crispa TaxID=139825 RepID=A0A401GBX6_9APHY|nr:Diphthine--ammonia ligase [Sparassis crispa]GBE79662.1 Diphthine--ammonia ligase [Sparassis crispa]
MKYVALLSGGKDSCYNLLHCFRNGHELVAAASLGPEHGKEELDSYLYQTVGQDAIEFVARSLDVPLYRRVISGAALQQGLEYGGRNPAESEGISGDETEDLYALLSTVKESLPEIQGVSVGAILSNYQRVRVEHVCRRLRLTPLCYLWQRDQAELLSEMIEAGMDAILIKVAGIGLTVKHLGRSLAEMQPTLMKLSNLYGSHICGEGGEYETLTLDCPIFKRRIKLLEVETVIHSDSDFATVAYLRVKNAVLESKTEAVTPDPAVPPLLSESYEQIRDMVSASLSSQPQLANDDIELSSKAEHCDSGVFSKRFGDWVSVTNVTIATPGSPTTLSIEDEVEQCFQKLQACLEEYSLKLSNCTNINIFLSSMDLFARVNAVYATFFGNSPPARACVAVDLHPPTRVKLDCIAYAERTPADRQALHVQGLSYWAPANIGPYSQGIIVDERVFISGQIGLVPSSLNLPSPPSLALETALSFQHVDRVLSAMKTDRWDGHVQGAIYWLANASDIPHVRKAAVSYMKDDHATTLFVAVAALPKNALMEKQVLVHTGRYFEFDEGELVTRSTSPQFADGDVTGTDGTCMHWEVSKFAETTAATALVCCRGTEDGVLSQLRDIVPLNALGSRALSIRLFYRPSRNISISQCHDFFEHAPLTAIPCRAISTKQVNDWDYAMLAIGT